MSATAVLCWVLAVSDGDTLKVRCADHASAAPVQVRIVGIDAPERRQAFGVQSRTQLQTLCLRRRAQLQIEGGQIPTYLGPGAMPGAGRSGPAGTCWPGLGVSTDP